MKKAISILLCLIFGIAYCQKSEIVSKQKIDNEIDIAYSELYTNTNNSLKKSLLAYNESKKIRYKKGIIESCKSIIILYIKVNKWSESIKYCDILESEGIEVNDNSAIAWANLQKGINLVALHLPDEAYAELIKAEKNANKISDKNDKHYSLSLVYENLAGIFNNSDFHESNKTPEESMVTFLKKAMKEAESLEDSKDNTESLRKYDMISSLSMNIGMYYTGIHKPQRLDIAEPYLLKSLKLIENKIGIDKKPILNSLGKFYIEKKEYNKAINYSKRALQIEKKSRSQFDRMVAYEVLKNSYESLGKKDSTLKYTKLYSDISDSISHFNDMAANSTTVKINSEKEKIVRHNFQKILIFVGIIIFILIITGVVIRKRQLHNLHKRYENIILNLKINKKEKESRAVNSDTLERSFVISDERINDLLLKLKKFEESDKFCQKDINITSLANSFNTNSRYLSEVINQYKEKNFQKYINSLRIQYITNILYENRTYRKYKTAHLAEICGFSSREVFSAVFKKETGMTPSNFINQLKNEESESEKN